MTVQTFRLILDREPTEVELDALFEAGCDDAMFTVEANVVIAQFDREAETMADAIVEAVKAVETAGLVPLRAVDQDLVTLADIADRIRQSRESIRRYVTGARGPGGFPPPVNPAREGTLFYRWSEVAPWVREHLGAKVEDVDPAVVVANLVLQVRQLWDQVEHAEVLAGLLFA
jgi:hypothetical protein